MFFLLYGEDTYRSKKKLAAMRERFSATRDASGLNTRALRAKEDDIDAVSEAVFASPFLAEKKLVVLEGYLRAPAADQERIEAMLGRKPESTVAIFFEDVGAAGLSKSPLLPFLARQKFTEECTALTGAQIERALVDECASQGVTLPPKTARAILSVVGEDSWQLHEEASKLCAYAKATGATAVTDAAVGLLVAGAREESLFALIDACTEGRCADAMSMLERLLDTGTSELQVVAMLEKQYRTLIAAADFIERGERDKNVVAKRLGIHPFPAGKAMAAARRHSPASLRARYGVLLEIERQMKTSAGAPNALLGLFMAKMAA
ncbi:MAG: hypothetical protein RL272_335 [Candidatus Parcubacteria bacterium]|jgi:DNA polymerase-3 subunit delta